MALLPVDEALSRLLEAASRQPRPVESVAVQEAAGRVLAEDLAAKRTQPPADLSAMDGFAVRAADVAEAGTTLRLAGESAAGHPFAGALPEGEAVRIFTGAVVPAGADAVIIQENASVDRGMVQFSVPARLGQHIRRAGCDFAAGAVLLRAGTRLNMGQIALAGAMDHAKLPVFRRPRIGILATGDELVSPGAPRRPDQIVATNTYAVAAMVRAQGGEVLDLGIAVDTKAALHAAFDRAAAEALDCLVTIGGASVGAHDLVRPVAEERGAEQDFYKIAMRPGKPLSFGRLGPMLLLGLPGNPVSSLVCARLFLLPLVAALQGDAEAGADATEMAVLAAPFPANDERQDYVRVVLGRGPDGIWRAEPAGSQDSSLLSVMSRANALLIRPPHAPAAVIGERARVIRLD